MRISDFLARRIEHQAQPAVQGAVRDAASDVARASAARSLDRALPSGRDRFESMVGSAIERLHPVSLLVPLDPAHWAPGMTAREVRMILGSPNHRMTPLQTSAVAVLSEAGEQRVAAARADLMTAARDELDQLVASQGLGATRPVSLDAMLDWGGGDVSHVLLDREVSGPFLDAYREAVSRGEAQATLGGQPWTRFFRVSDDIQADLQVESLQRLSPGFRNRAPEEQRAVAALASRDATRGPRAVPWSTRLAVAEALVRHERIGPAGREVREAWRELATRERLPARPFFHGTRSGEAIVQDGFRVGENNLMGEGIYHGNPAVAAHYATRGGGRDPEAVQQIVSGVVLPGRTVSERLAPNPEVMSAVMPENRDGGDYWVTRDPARFQIRGLTTLDPALAPSRLPRVAPRLVEALAAGPEATPWARRWLDRLDPLAIDRLATRQVATDPRSAGASLWLALRGEPDAIRGLPALMAVSQPESARLAAAAVALELLPAVSPELGGTLGTALEALDRPLREQLVQTRAALPGTVGMATSLLESGDSGVARKRVLDAWKGEAGLVPDLVRERTTRWTPEARIQMKYDLGRLDRGFRPLLEDVVQEASGSEQGFRAAALLLRDAGGIDDARWSRLAGLVQARDTAVWRQVAIDTVPFDRRFLDGAFEAFEQDSSAYVRDRAKRQIEELLPGLSPEEAARVQARLARA
ncbi:MAG: hypothetical protein VKP72_07290 [bacterium]|nr:hypothetical protein [bacterium]